MKKKYSKKKNEKPKKALLRIEMIIQKMLEYIKENI